MVTDKDIEFETWFIGNIIVNTVVFTLTKKGSVIMGACVQHYDLRYCTSTDLHKAMLDELVSRGLNFTNEIMLS